MRKNVSLRRHLFSAMFVVLPVLLGFPAPTVAQTVFFAENFDNNNFASRGWYDMSGGGGTIDSSNSAPGSAASWNSHWAQGGASPVAGVPGRHKFPDSDTVYVSFWIKLGTASTTWQGSGLPWHPHMMYLLTNADGDYVGPAWSNLEFLIEPNGFTPRLGATDGKRINTGQLGVNLLGSGTSHAIAGGNGNQNGTSGYYSNGDGTYSNGTFWDSTTTMFRNDTWHHVEVFVAMNSVVAGVPQRDGIVKMWIDGALVVDEANVYLRSAQFATQKFNQFLLAPYLVGSSGGSPIAQDLWIDDLLVADQPPAPQAGIPAPTNLRVVR